MSIISLSLITITKDDPSGLARTLKSAEPWRLLADVEQLVVYGGDKVPDIKEASVKIFRQQSTGIANAFNEGLRQASGEWIWFINGGDAIHETLNPRWLKELLFNTQAEIVTGALCYDGAPVPSTAPPLRLQWPIIPCWIPHPATFVRKSTLTNLGGFDPRWKICMDYDLWFRLLSKSVKIDVVAVPFARFDVTGLSNRLESRELMLRENAAVVWQYRMIILRTCWQKTWAIVHLFLSAAKIRWF